MLTAGRAARWGAALLLLVAAVPWSSSSPSVLRITGFAEDWRVELPQAPQGSGQALVGDAVVMRTGDLLTARDAATGAERWSHRTAGGWISDWAAPLPALVVDMARPDRTEPTHSVIGLSAGTGRVLWRRTGLAAAGTWRAPYGGAAPTGVVVTERAPFTLVGTDAGTGADRWTVPLRCADDSRAIEESASDGRSAVVLYRCGRRFHVLALDTVAGTRRWSTPVPATATRLTLDQGTVTVRHGNALSVLDDRDGRLVTRLDGCWNGCTAERAGGRLVLSHESGGGGVLEGVSLPGLTPLWRRTLPTPRALGRPEAPYQSGWTSGGIYFAVPRSARDGAPARVHAVDPATGNTREFGLPGFGLPFARAGNRVFTVQRFTLPARAPRFRVTAFRSASPDPWGETPPGADRTRWPDACEVLRRLRPASRPARLWNPATCQATSAEGHRLVLRVRWQAPDRASAALLFARMREAGGGVTVPDVADAAFSVGPRAEILTFLSGRTIIDVRSAYLPVVAELPALAREVARLLPVTAAFRGPGGETAAPPPSLPVPLPATAEAMAVPTGPSAVLAGYRNGETTVLIDPGTGRSVPARYPFTAFSPGGRWAAGVSPDYIKGRDYAYVLDRTTGKVRKLPGFEHPRQLWDPVWSSRGDLLLTVWEETDEDDDGDDEDDMVSVGFVVHSPRAGTTRFVRVGDPRAGGSRYQWNGDGTGVATELAIDFAGNEADGGDGEADLRAVGRFDLRGRPVEGPAAPGRMSELDDWYSPSRNRYAVVCPRRTTDVCVHDAGSGALIAQVDQVAGRLVAWYDDDAFLIRNRSGAALSITVVDLLRGSIADIARSSDERDGDLRLFFARRPGGSAPA
ncbi:outer membrane protein assembly factor BamB family protein [Streptosporangium canum]|uniref:outer membrane protein assembly factor BamB family protein n=1 Tax=Streptosporangium canum TaxID=324952 RepID=UPI00379A37F2